MDIRSVLKKVSLPDLKNIVRKHNQHFTIKIGQRKADLIDAIAGVYKELSGSFLIPKEFKLRLTELAKQGVIKKKVKQQAAPAPALAPALAPAPRAVPLPVFIKATPALKERVRKYKEAKKKRAEQQEEEEEEDPLKVALDKDIKKFNELLIQKKPAANLNKMIDLSDNIHTQIINFFRDKFKKDNIAQEVAGKTNKQLEALAKTYVAKYKDLVKINTTIRDRVSDAALQVQPTLPILERQKYYRYINHDPDAIEGTLAFILMNTRDR